MTGARVLPIGTVYDPFVNRGLDALIYACYQDARFLLVATPSGLTLAPEGGQHQSINTPLIGMAADRLASFEPAHVDELAILLRHAFDHMQRPDGSSVWLRLSTRQLEQPERTLDERAVIDGRALGGAAGGRRAHRDRLPGAGGAGGSGGVRRTGSGGAGRRTAGDHQSGPAACRLDRRVARTTQRRPNGACRISSVCWRRWRRHAALVTVLDGHPATHSWLGAVRGQRVVPLGPDHFGQSGDIPDLYREYDIDADAILEACAQALLA